VPYHCRLAVESALVAMPDSTIEFHIVGRLPRSGHLSHIERHPQVRVHDRDLDEVFAACPGGAGPYLALADRLGPGVPAALSNLVRLAVLYRDGGIYLDTDVIVLAPINPPSEGRALVGCEQVWALNRSRVGSGLTPGVVVRSVPWASARTLARLDSRLAHGRGRLADRIREPSGSVRNQVNNAVIAAPPRSPFVGRSLQRARLVDPAKRFALGPHLLDDVARDHPRDVEIAPPHRFYAIPPGQSFRCFEDRYAELPPDAEVLHYVASNHRSLLGSLDIDDERFASGQAPFWREARRVRASLGARHGTSRGTSGGVSR
jgi:Glycosyltransferase sugar-binding region containing DXD motif